MPSVVVAQSIADIVSSLFRVGGIIEIDIASYGEGVPLDVEAAELQLSRTLQEGPQRINTEYIAHLRSAGPMFASGDGTAHATLASILAQVQAVVDADFVHKRPEGFQLSDLHDWNSVCFNVVKETVTALAQLHQRLPKGGRVMPSLKLPILNPPNILYGTFTTGGSACSCFSDKVPNRYTGYYLPRRVRHGRGVEVWSTGDRYDGGWKFNKMHGYGIYTYANGDVYDGDWQNSQKHGRGHLKKADGEIYRGQWQSGLKAGYGVAIYPNKSTYEGFWKNNLPCGFGFMVQPSKERIEGGFAGGMAHGYAVTTSFAGPMYKGQWNHGRRNGFGVGVDVSDGEYYDGEWKDNLKHGSGVSIRLNGEKFEGNWENGELKTTRTL